LTWERDGGGSGRGGEGGMDDAGGGVRVAVYLFIVYVGCERCVRARVPRGRSSQPLMWCGGTETSE